MDSHSKPVKSIAPLHAVYARLAYSYYEEAGKPYGQADIHWLQAEQDYNTAKETKKPVLPVMTPTTSKRKKAKRS